MAPEGAGNGVSGENPDGGRTVTSQSPAGPGSSTARMAQTRPQPQMRPTAPPPGRPAALPLGQRQVTIRRLDPWTILKLSVVFYTCLLLLFMLVLTLFWAFINQIGAVDTVLTFLAEARFEVEVNAGHLARGIFLLGLLGMVVGSGVNIFFCFLYNLVADLTGGLRLTLDDEGALRSGRP